jgi:hypothetical protein
MPIEVREIGIRLAIDDGGGDAEAPSAQAVGSGRLSWADRNAIVEQCVRAVLDEINRRRER